MFPSESYCEKKMVLYLKKIIVQASSNISYIMNYFTFIAIYRSFILRGIDDRCAIFEDVAVKDLEM
jgi:hypothetical protein